MKVLVACEESQTVCTAFRNKGHEAYSCDIQECSGRHPEWHIKQDVLPLINGSCEFKTCDGKGNKNWMPKQQVIYEKEHGPIPSKHKVIFADGNRFNFDINNLILVSNSEELIMNRNSLRFDDKELTKTGSIIAKVMDKTNKVKNERL